MKPFRNTWVRAAALFALPLLAGCEDEAQQGAPPGGAPAAGATPAAAASAAASSGPELAAFKDSDFVESDGNRDPFRSFAAQFSTRATAIAQRAVLMPETPVDAMKLIAIISGVEQPRAMLVDEKGVGHVTTRGDFVGKAEVVQSGGAENLAVTINWRVDRIRENEVVLAREDPTGPNRPPLTRVIPLHEEEDESG